MRKRFSTDEDGFEGWGGYMAAKKSKLHEQFKADTKADNENTDGKSHIFENISVFVNGLTVPSADEIKRIMMIHGGEFHHYYSHSKTKYIIASNLADAKIKLLKGEPKIVKPSWITDSLKALKLLDYRDYLLYSHKTPGQSTISFPTINQKESSTKSSIKAGDANFLSEFYSHSRLHYIATMGITFKQHIHELRQKHDGKYPGINEFKNWLRKQNYYMNNNTDDTIYMHIDMDCFFVSVGLRNHPELRNLPVAVTHSRNNSSSTGTKASVIMSELECYKERMEQKSKDTSTIKNKITILTEDETYSMSEIASCSYEARKAGIKNGMLLGAALKKCPELKTIPYDFDGYKQVSFILYNTVASFTLNIEPVSCDEMYVDCSEILKQTNSTPIQFATFLRQKIKNETGCPASTGFGPNILLARLATRKAKPDGSYYLSSDKIADEIKDIMVQDLPGVGRTLNYKLDSMKTRTCGELQKLSIEELQLNFGQKTGQMLYNFCRGRDDRKLNIEFKRKSVSAEVNYGIRFEKNEEVIKFINELAIEVKSRLDECKCKGRGITLKLMVKAKGAPSTTAKFLGHGVCDSLSRSVTLPSETNDSTVIAKETVKLWKLLNISACNLRGMGIQITKLSETIFNNKQDIINKFFKTKSIDKKKVEENKDIFIPEEIVIEDEPEILFSEQCNISSNRTPTPTITDKIIDQDDDVFGILKLNMNLNDMLPLMRSWCNSGLPEEMDKQLINKFLKKLILTHRLDKVGAVLRTLHREINQMKCKQWQEIYLYFVNDVQNLMLQKYGSTLKAETEFS